MLASHHRQRPLSLLHLQQLLLLAPQNPRDQFVDILIRIIGEAGRSVRTQKIRQASNRAQTRRQFRAQKARGQISQRHWRKRCSLLLNLRQTVFFKLQLSLEEVTVLIDSVDEDLYRLVVQLTLLLVLHTLSQIIPDFYVWTIDYMLSNYLVNLRLYCLIEPLPLSVLCCLSLFMVVYSTDCKAYSKEATSLLLMSSPYF